MLLMEFIYKNDKLQGKIIIQENTTNIIEKTEENHEAKE